MQIISLNGYNFMLDDDIYDKLNKLHLTVNLSRNKPYLQILLENGKYLSAAKFILDCPNKTTFLDKNPLNLLKTNLSINTPETKLIKSSYKHRSKFFYEKNKERLNNVAKQYYLDNKTHKLQLQKDYRKKTNYIKDKKYHRTLKGKYNNLVHGTAKRIKKGRVMGMNITLEQYDEIINKTCYYCSKDLFLETGGSLDRIDNSKGYLIDNVLPCCGFCNKLRQDLMTVDETKHVVSALIEYRKQKDK